MICERCGHSMPDGSLTCENCGTKYFIPNTSQGLAISTYPGVYEAVSEEIDKMSRELFQ